MLPTQKFFEYHVIPQVENPTLDLIYQVKVKQTTGSLKTLHKVTFWLCVVDLDWVCFLCQLVLKGRKNPGQSKKQALLRVKNHTHAHWSQAFQIRNAWPVMMAFIIHNSYGIYYVPNTMHPIRYRYCFYPNLQMGKLRNKEPRWAASGLIVTSTEQTLNKSGFFSESLSLTTTLPCLSNNLWITFLG